MIIILDKNNWVNVVVLLILTIPLENVAYFYSSSEVTYH